MDLTPSLARLASQTTQASLQTEERMLAPRWTTRTSGASPNGAKVMDFVRLREAAAAEATKQISFWPRGRLSIFVEAHTHTHRDTHKRIVRECFLSLGAGFGYGPGFATSASLLLLGLDVRPLARSCARAARKHKRAPQQLKSVRISKSPRLVWKLVSTTRMVVSLLARLLTRWLAC